MTIRQGPSFSFAYDADVEAVCIAMTGFWSMETVERYSAAVLANMAARPCEMVMSRVLLDLRQAQLHRSEIERALADFHRIHTPHIAKLAAIVRSSIDGSQVMRISSAAETRTFATLPEALHWLA